MGMIFEFHNFETEEPFTSEDGAEYLVYVSYGEAVVAYWDSELRQFVAIYGGSGRTAIDDAWYFAKLPSQAAVYENMDKEF